MGTVQMVTGEWKMVVYYELAPVETQYNTFVNGIFTLDKLCIKLQQGSACHTLVGTFEHTRDDILQEKILLNNRRDKRGAINLVGNVAKTLFGVLDSNYAENMAQTINQLKEDNNHLARLLQNQTSIIDSTLNILKRDEVTVNNQLGQLQDQISQVLNRIDNETEQIKITQIFLSIAIQLTLMDANLQRIQAEIINVLIDSHHGKISPLLLSPQQLKNEIKHIRSHIPLSRRFPVNQDDLVQLYRIMEISGAVTKEQIIVVIKVPLIDSYDMELFRILHIPTVINNTNLTIKSDVSFTAVNTFRVQYIPLRENELDNCQIPNKEVYICSRKHIKLGRYAETHTCEIELFNNRTATSCRLTQLSNKMVWTKMEQTNQWIYATVNRTEISSVCGTQLNQVTIEGSGILTLRPECTIRNNLVTIQGHYSLSSVVHSSFLHVEQLASITTPNEIKTIINKADDHLDTQLKELSKLHQRLKAMDKFSVKAEPVSQPHHIISYVGTILLLTLCCTYVIYKSMKKCKQTRRQDNSPQSESKVYPQPTPIRQQLVVEV
ncbi:uncharacterized protein LOC119688653 [Teleopsis dalmanni]|uniref:uncharacterized protein LOC119688653 n=1 Tax=Teleopsis dalmanni TaxID=139649 RepID=UPI0018CD5986|nr:uncharacterized protein LOC119688653 [Teleopsis dalmanni]